MKSEPFHDSPRSCRAGNFAARAACCFLILALGGTARAQLRWEERSLEFHPSLTDTRVVAEFHFMNAGNKPVKIVDTGVSCGCTTATLEKKHVYAPGEKGKVTAVYDIGNHSGEQKESVLVTTDEPGEKGVTLQLAITIPKLLDLERVFLNWQPGEELKPKTVNIKAMGNYPVHRLSVSSTSTNVSAEIKHAEGSRDYQLVITPKKANPEFVIVEIKPDYPKDPPKLYNVYVSVGR